MKIKMFFEMFVSLIYFVLIVSFNHCCGASHLIPTTVLSPSVMRPSRQHMSVGSMNTAAANAYSLYALPYNSQFNSRPNINLKYSASYAQPVVEQPRVYNIKNVVNANVERKPNYAKSYVILASNKTAQAEYGTTLPLSSVKSVSNRLTERKPRTLSTQISSGFKPINSGQIKSILYSTTKAPKNPNYSYERLAEPSPTIKRPKLNSVSNATDFVKINNVLYNKLFQTAQPLQQTHRQRDKPQNQPQSQSQPQTQSQQTYDQYLQQTQDKYLTKQQNSRYSPQQSQSEQRHGFTFEIRPDSKLELKVDVKPQPKPLTTPEPTPEPRPEEYKELEKDYRFESGAEQERAGTSVDWKSEEGVDSDKKEKLSSIDSVNNYQMDFFDVQKDANSNYEPLLQTDPINSYGALTNENNVLSNTENYQYFDQNPESESEGLDQFDDNSDKHSADTSYDDNNGDALKSLLEQFIHQLDVLKSVASKELTKTSEDSYSYGSKPLNSDIISQTVVEPLVPKAEANYNDYQNDRSFEQNLSNLEPKSYKDTNEKRKSSCNKHPIFHPGALPYTGAYN